MFPLLSIGVPLEPILFLAIGLVFAFLIGFEVIWGKTPAKKLFGLKVVKTDGTGVDVFSSLVRNLLRIVDHMLFIGAFVAAASQKKQRIGDKLAGTVVIKDR